MRDQPQPLGDPYRVLGLEPGASMAEVKRAYRRLAKAYHPDSAGQAALPRFLAIHEAYERLVTGRSRAGGAGSAGARTTRTTPPGEPWRADPERARAARERARTGRARTGTAGTAAGPTGGSAGASGRGGGTSRTGTGGGSGSAGTSGRRRSTRKATLGSTSYDEAREQSDATWSGASWYGPSSGEYWIVNPREYADPRKHGPGYQQRARRATPAPGSGTGTGESTGSADFEITEEEPAVEGSAPPGSGGSAAADPTAEATGGAAASARDARRRRAAERPAWAPADQTMDPSTRGWEARDRAWPGDAGPRDPFASLGSAGRDLLGGPTDDPIRRLGLALVAWPPIGLAAAAAIGDLTGCTTYSAECGGSDALLPWLAQAAILGLLLLLPPLTRLFVGGTIAILFALVPITMFLLVVGAGGAPQAPFAMTLLVAAAWIVGLVWTARGAARPAT